MHQVTAWRMLQEMLILLCKVSDKTMNTCGLHVDCLSALDDASQLFPGTVAVCVAEDLVNSKWSLRVARQSQRMSDLGRLGSGRLHVVTDVSKGSWHCLHRLELMEAAGCSLLACTLAWRPAGGLGSGPETIQAAAAGIRAALRRAALPVADAAPAVKVHIPPSSSRHLQDFFCLCWNYQTQGLRA